MPLSGLTILVVDDNEIHSYALARTLQAYNARIFEAHTGANTLILAKQVRPDVILQDVNLPDMNGFLVCATLKADSDTTDIAVIFITATYHNSFAKAEAEQAGGATVLFHPVEPQQLVAVIKAQVRKSRAFKSSRDV